MKQNFSQYTKAIMLTIGLALFGCGASADNENTAVSQVGEFRAGTDYQIVDQPERLTRSDDKIEVVEVFWYGCPHCFSLEPDVQRWSRTLEADVNFQQMPAALNRSWKQHAKAYYAAQSLNILEPSHERLFQKLHLENQRIISDNALARFYSDFGPSEDEFTAAMNSFGVDSQVRTAERLAGQWGLNSVPAIIVNGKYVTSPSMAGGNRRMFQIINALIEQERANP